jgi:hypothetical protein
MIKSLRIRIKPPQDKDYILTGSGSYPSQDKQQTTTEEGSDLYRIRIKPAQDKEQPPTG